MGRKVSQQDKKYSAVFSVHNKRLGLAKEIRRRPYHPSGQTMDSYVLPFFHFTSSAIKGFLPLIEDPAQANDFNAVFRCICNFFRELEGLAYLPPPLVGEPVETYFERIANHPRIPSIDKEETEDDDASANRYPIFAREKSPRCQLEARILSYRIKDFLSMFEDRELPAGVSIYSDIVTIKSAVSSWMDGFLADLSANNPNQVNSLDPETYINNPRTVLPLNKKTPRGGERFFETVAKDRMQEMLKDVVTFPEFYPNEKSIVMKRIHETDNPLCLCWSEIWFALEYGIRARLCPYCNHRVYTVPKNNPRMAHCQSASCKRAYDIERRGGIEKYRAHETIRKKKAPTGKMGRPRKQVKGNSKEVQQ